MIEKVKYEVSLLLENDDSGHDMCHINRVLDLALRFSENLEVDKEFVSLIALLHDVDDYKLVGIENSEKLTNAKLIMDKVSIEENIQNKVLEQIKYIGYSKRLKGIVPNCLECMVVSDADMCDALGVNGVLRTYKYSIKNNKPFFDRNYFPIDNLDGNTYVNKTSEHSVCHIFEKILIPFIV